MSATWLNHKIPNMDGFCWCIIGINLPMRMFTGSLSWGSNQIYQLKEAIENHLIGGEQIWLQKWCPLSTEIDGKDLTLIRRDNRYFANRHKSTIASLGLKRYETSVYFYPENSMKMKEPNPKYGGWYRLWFDARGLFLGYIGIPWGTKETVKGEEVLTAMYSLLDLCILDSIRVCYQDCLWDGGRFEAFAQVNQLAGIVELSSDEVVSTENIVVKGSSWSGPFDSEKIDFLTPEKSARDYTKKFLAWAGLLNYEQYIDNFDIKSFIAKY